MNFRYYFAAAVLSIALPRMANAQTAPETWSSASVSSEDRVKSAEGSRWYGWQTLAADGGALALVLSSGLAMSYNLAPIDRALMYGGVGAFALGAPAVHMAHKQPWRAVGSLGMRVGLPAGLAALGMWSEDCSRGRDFCGVIGAFTGFVIGTATAIAVDAAALSYEEAPREATRNASAATFSLVPTFVPQTKQGGLALSGAF